MIQRNSYYLSEKIIALSSIMLQNDTKLYKIENKNDTKKKEKTKQENTVLINNQVQIKTLKVGL